MGVTPNRLQERSLESVVIGGIKGKESAPRHLSVPKCSSYNTKLVTGKDLFPRQTNYLILNRPRGQHKYTHVHTDKQTTAKSINAFFPFLTVSTEGYHKKAIDEASTRQKRLKENEDKKIHLWLIYHFSDC